MTKLVNAMEFPGLIVSGIVGQKVAAMIWKQIAGSGPPVHLTPMTTDPSVAADWFARFEGAGLDGVVAKGVDLAYVEDKRLMLKVKHDRTADCVVAGFRWHKDGGGVGSLLLGLYDEAGTRIGSVADILERRAHDILFIRDDEKETAEYYVPFTQEHVPTVDPEGGRVVVDFSKITPE